MNSRITTILTFLLLIGGITKANSWIQKADITGGARYAPSGFSIGTKGYIGTGASGITYLQDFWAWDQGTNTWTQKANFGGVARDYAVGFAIGSKGYIGTGYDGNSIIYQDFWEYDPAANTWTQKANFPHNISDATGFSIGSYGYIGTGIDTLGNIFSDFYQWNQGTNIWTQIANFPPVNGRMDAVGISIGSKGYVGAGGDYVDLNTDFWEYTPDVTEIIETSKIRIVVKLFPNPVSMTLNIQGATLTNSIISIWNVKGEVVNKETLSAIDNSIDVSKWSAGIYFYEIRGEKETYRGKIVVN